MREVDGKQTSREPQGGSPPAQQSHAEEAAFQSRFKTWIRAVAFLLVAVFIPEQAAAGMSYDPSVIWQHLSPVSSAGLSFTQSSPDPAVFNKAVAASVERFLKPLVNNPVHSVQIKPGITIDLNKSSLRRAGLSAGASSQGKGEAVLSRDDLTALVSWLQKPETETVPCSAYTLYHLLQSRGRAVSVEEVSSLLILIDILAGTINASSSIRSSRFDNSLYALQKAAAYFGLDTRPVSLAAKEEVLSSKVSPPFIAHLRDLPKGSVRKSYNGHFVLVTSVEQEKVHFYFDKGSSFLPRGKFLEAFSGYALVLGAADGLQPMADRDAKVVRGARRTYREGVIIDLDEYLWDGPDWGDVALAAGSFALSAVTAGAGGGLGSFATGMATSQIGMAVSNIAVHEFDMDPWVAQGLGSAVSFGMNGAINADHFNANPLNAANNLHMDVFEQVAKEAVKGLAVTGLKYGAWELIKDTGFAENNPQVAMSLTSLVGRTAGHIATDAIFNEVFGIYTPTSHLLEDGQVSTVFGSRPDVTNTFTGPDGQTYGWVTNPSMGNVLDISLTQALPDLIQEGSMIGAKFLLGEDNLISPILGNAIGGLGSAVFSGDFSKNALAMVGQGVFNGAISAGLGLLGGDFDADSGKNDWGLTRQQMAGVQWAGSTLLAGGVAEIAGISGTQGFGEQAGWVIKDSVKDFAQSYMTFGGTSPLSNGAAGGWSLLMYNAKIAELGGYANLGMRADLILKELNRMEYTLDGEDSRPAAGTWTWKDIREGRAAEYGVTRGTLLPDFMESLIDYTTANFHWGATRMMSEALRHALPTSVNNFFGSDDIRTKYDASGRAWRSESAWRGFFDSDPYHNRMYIGRKGDEILGFMSNQKFLYSDPNILSTDRMVFYTGRSQENIRLVSEGDNLKEDSYSLILDPSQAPLLVSDGVANARYNLLGRQFFESTATLSAQQYQEFHRVTGMQNPSFHLNALDPVKTNIHITNSPFSFHYQAITPPSPGLKSARTQNILLLDGGIDHDLKTGEWTRLRVADNGRMFYSQGVGSKLTGTAVGRNITVAFEKMPSSQLGAQVPEWYSLSIPQLTLQVSGYATDEVNPVHLGRIQGMQKHSGGNLGQGLRQGDSSAAVITMPLGVDQPWKANDYSLGRQDRGKRSLYGFLGTFNLRADSTLQGFNQQFGGVPVIQAGSLSPVLSVGDRITLRSNVNLPTSIHQVLNHPVYTPIAAGSVIEMRPLDVIAGAGGEATFGKSYLMTGTGRKLELDGYYARMINSGSGQELVLQTTGDITRMSRVGQDSLLVTTPIAGNPYGLSAEGKLFTGWGSQRVRFDNANTLLGQPGKHITQFHVAESIVPNAGSAGSGDLYAHGSHATLMQHGKEFNLYQNVTFALNANSQAAFRALMPWNAADSTLTVPARFTGQDIHFPNQLMLRSRGAFILSGELYQGQHAMFAQAVRLPKRGIPKDYLKGFKLKDGREVGIDPIGEQWAVPFRVLKKGNELKVNLATGYAPEAILVRENEFKFVKNAEKVLRRNFKITGVGASEARLGFKVDNNINGRGFEFGIAFLQSTPAHGETSYAKARIDAAENTAKAIISPSLRNAASSVFTYSGRENKAGTAFLGTGESSILLFSFAQPHGRIPDVGEISGQRWIMQSYGGKAWAAINKHNREVGSISLQFRSKTPRKIGVYDGKQWRWQDGLNARMYALTRDGIALRGTAYAANGRWVANKDWTANGNKAHTGFGHLAKSTGVNMSKSQLESKFTGGKDGDKALPKNISRLLKQLGRAEVEVDVLKKTAKGSIWSTIQLFDKTGTILAAPWGQFSDHYTAAVTYSIINGATKGKIAGTDIARTLKFQNLYLGSSWEDGSAGRLRFDSRGKASLSNHMTVLTQQKQEFAPSEVIKSQDVTVRIGKDGAAISSTVKGRIDSGSSGRAFVAADKLNDYFKRAHAISKAKGTFELYNNFRIKGKKNSPVSTLTDPSVRLARNGAGFVLPFGLKQELIINPSLKSNKLDVKKGLKSYLTDMNPRGRLRLTGENRARGATIDKISANKVRRINKEYFGIQAGETFNVVLGQTGKGKPFAIEGYRAGEQSIEVKPHVIYRDGQRTVDPSGSKGVVLHLEKSEDIKGTTILKNAKTRGVWITDKLALVDGILGAGARVNLGYTTFKTAAGREFGLKGGGLNDRLGRISYEALYKSHDAQPVVYKVFYSDKTGLIGNWGQLNQALAGAGLPKFSDMSDQRRLSYAPDRVKSYVYAPQVKLRPRLSIGPLLMQQAANGQYVPSELIFKAEVKNMLIAPLPALKRGASVRGPAHIVFTEPEQRAATRKNTGVQPDLSLSRYDAYPLRKKPGLYGIVSDTGLFSVSLHPGKDNRLIMGQELLFRNAVVALRPRSNTAATASVTRVSTDTHTQVIDLALKPGGKPHIITYDAGGVGKFEDGDSKDILKQQVKHATFDNKGKLVAGRSIKWNDSTVRHTTFANGRLSVKNYNKENAAIHSIDAGKLSVALTGGAKRLEVDFDKGIFFSGDVKVSRISGFDVAKLNSKDPAVRRNQQELIIEYIQETMVNGLPDALMNNLNNKNILSSPVIISRGGKDRQTTVGKLLNNVSKKNLGGILRSWQQKKHVKLEAGSRNESIFSGLVSLYYYMTRPSYSALPQLMPENGIEILSGDAAVLAGGFDSLVRRLSGVKGPAAHFSYLSTYDHIWNVFSPQKDNQAGAISLDFFRQDIPAALPLEYAKDNYHTLEFRRPADSLQQIKINIANEMGVQGVSQSGLEGFLRQSGVISQGAQLQAGQSGFFIPVSRAPGKEFLTPRPGYSVPHRRVIGFDGRKAVIGKVFSFSGGLVQSVVDEATNAESTIIGGKVFAGASLNGPLEKVAPDLLAVPLRQNGEDRYVMIGKNHRTPFDLNEAYNKPKSNSLAARKDPVLRPAPSALDRIQSFFNDPKGSFAGWYKTAKQQAAQKTQGPPRNIAVASVGFYGDLSNYLDGALSPFAHTIGWVFNSPWALTEWTADQLGFEPGDYYRKRFDHHWYATGKSYGQFYMGKSTLSPDFHADILFNDWLRAGVSDAQLQDSVFVSSNSAGVSFVEDMSKFKGGRPLRVNELIDYLNSEQQKYREIKGFEKFSSRFGQGMQDAMTVYLATQWIPTRLPHIGLSKVMTGVRWGIVAGYAGLRQLFPEQMSSIEAGLKWGADAVIGDRFTYAADGKRYRIFADKSAGFGDLASNNARVFFYRNGKLMTGFIDDRAVTRLLDARGDTSALALQRRVDRHAVYGASGNVVNTLYIAGAVKSAARNAVRKVNVIPRSAVGSQQLSVGSILAPRIIKEAAVSRAVVSGPVLTALSGSIGKAAVTTTRWSVVKSAVKTGNISGAFKALRSSTNPATQASWSAVHKAIQRGGQGGGISRNTLESTLNTHAGYVMGKFPKAFQGYTKVGSFGKTFVQAPAVKKELL
ncbi:MAG: cysteine peptidase family C39 domain-containing protein, partial [Candidatus Omnitrophica bacterium]|nr:cysteine peptidase family C39 domain-containing protein [Candidatus Omnitrophota bacterium]